MSDTKPKTLNLYAPNILQAVAELAESERRSKSQMAAILIEEALVERGRQEREDNTPLAVIQARETADAIYERHRRQYES